MTYAREEIIQDNLIEGDCREGLGKAFLGGG